MRYRILKTFRLVGTGTRTPPNVLWVGSDLNEAGIEFFYNPIFDRPGFSGDIEWVTYWECSTDGVVWKECEVPISYIKQFDRSGKRRNTRM